MKPSIANILILASLTTGMLAASAPAAVVYQNNPTMASPVFVLLDQGEVNSAEDGNQITLAGTQRLATNFLVHLRLLGGGVATFKARIRFRLNDGPDGKPGTIIWDSGPQMRVIDSGAPIGYSFPVPNVIVPDSFTYTIQITDRAGNMSYMGPVENNPPIVGSAGLGFWRRTGDGPEEWVYIGLEEPFCARLDAIPCFGTQNGDMNVDGFVDGRDVARMTGAILAGSSQSTELCHGDFNFNGIIDVNDLPLFVQWILNGA